MFGRWSQENFFRYLIADYDFDKMIEFGVETIAWEMPEKIRFNKLKTESKLLMNVIKMICYRAESAVASKEINQTQGTSLIDTFTKSPCHSATHRQHLPCNIQREV